MNTDKKNSARINGLDITSKKIPWFYIFILIIIILAGAYFRLIGINWGENHHLHPDERFLTMVETAIKPVESINEYFDTNNSSLNPHNRGYGFYVYGTLPIFIVRYIAEWVGETGYDQVHIIGRIVSACFDLMTVILVFFISWSLYKKIGISLLATAFSSAAVLQIQLSHYFTVDSFALFFTFLSIYFAVLILKDEPESWLYNSEINDGDNEKFNNIVKFLFKDKSFINYILFGFSFGMALASKISVVPLAIVLPAAAYINTSGKIKNENKTFALIILKNLIFAGLASLIVFRIFQPYAFSGPGFFGVNLNPKWLSNLHDLSLQSAGNVDFPPALQWARRPLWFAWENMVKWGLGLPLGLLSWIGFIWMGVKIFKGKWKEHLLIWVWTGIYFTWQSINFTRSMRYQLPIYPTLCIIAAWFIVYIWQRASISKKFITIKKSIPIILGIVVVSSTFIWAFAFTRIYTRPVTRVEASRWIYQNVPGAINLKIENDNAIINQPLPFRSETSVNVENPLVIKFTANYSGSLEKLVVSNLVDQGISEFSSSIRVKLFNEKDPGSLIAEAVLSDLMNTGNDPRGDKKEIIFIDKPIINSGDIYLLSITADDTNSDIKLSGTILLEINSDNKQYTQYLPDPVDVLRENQDYTISFTANSTGTINKIYLPYVVDWEGINENKNIQLTLSALGEDDNIKSSGSISDSFNSSNDPRGKEYTVEFETPIQVVEGKQYNLQIQLIEGDGSIALYGSKHANESSWDDPLPIGLDGYNPFDYYMGVYRTELNFEMYWDDNEEKRERFINILNQTDYLFISSNRQWGTTVRVSERYPLTSTYYRNLIGCPIEKDIVWCYRVAEPGMFSGNLGYDLIEVFQSDPNIGDIKFNTQFAEEAFTVYDHPKVLIFKKNDNFDPKHIEEIFNSVDLSQVIHLTPREAKGSVGTLMLPLDRYQDQKDHGTWATLFNRDQIINQIPFVGIVIWYFSVFLLGLMFYPLVRILFLHLPDKGYPVSKLIAFIVVSLIVWLLGSYEIPFERLTISIVVLILFFVNLFIYLFNREIINNEIKNKWKYILVVEGIALIFFLFFLMIRWLNPDLWHPAKGGEKPMNFSYFNAILKSTSFPPYDPWYAGGYINYYYYGYVIVGIFVKLLGLIPSIAYNVILPTWFSFTALTAFSFGYNVFALDNKKKLDGNDSIRYISGLLSSLFVVVLGNLGTVRMIWQGLQKLASPDGTIENANIINKLSWGVGGVFKLFSGQKLPYGPGDWYWIPSRTIPGEPITEFPFFTYLYADLHAHLIALPITILILLWCISFLASSRQWGKLLTKRTILSAAFMIFFGSIFIGALYPTNTWDYYTYLILALVVVLYSTIRNLGEYKSKANQYKSVIVVLLLCGILYGFSKLFYIPFYQWFGQGYSSIEIWKGDHTPINSYLTHWGIFLFLILSWLIWETRDWMAHTPISALNKYKPYKVLIEILMIIFIILIIGMIIYGISISWIVIPICVWSGLLIFRNNQNDTRRLVLFLIGTAAIITLVVELIVIKGDIGRMNTVFKFYYQAWTLFALSSSISLIWLLPSALDYSGIVIKNIWTVLLSFLIVGGFLFPIFGGTGKIVDRMSPDAPKSVDGMTYMAYSTYSDNGVDMDLVNDYNAIIWMQDNIVGSPVIVEANTPEYRWGSRFTIYTGLPGVVGWNWHQRQQRAVVPSQRVTERVDDVGEFYNTTDIDIVYDFINKYEVEYIIVGQLEHAYYEKTGIDKFENYEGILWNRIYNGQNTRIYQVIIRN